MGAEMETLTPTAAMAAPSGVEMTLRVGRRLGQARSERRLSVDQVAQRLGVEAVVVELWEAGVNPPDDLAARIEDWIAGRESGGGVFASAQAEALRARSWRVLNEEMGRIHRAIARSLERSDELVLRAASDYLRAVRDERAPALSVDARLVDAEQSLAEMMRLLGEARRLTREARRRAGAGRAGVAA
jgi:transcriptional regulator with XRE-family HTH domain